MSYMSEIKCSEIRRSCAERTTRGLRVLMWLMGFVISFACFLVTKEYAMSEAIVRLQEANASQEQRILENRKDIKEQYRIIDAKLEAILKEMKK